MPKSTKVRKTSSSRSRTAARKPAKPLRKTVATGVAKRKVTKIPKAVSRKIVAKKTARPKKAIVRKRTVRGRTVKRKAITLERNPLRPYDRHLLPDVEEPTEGPPARRARRRSKADTSEPEWVKIWNNTQDLEGETQWSSIALFFNLPPGQRPSDYKTTTAGAVLRWLDAMPGAQNADPTISTFMRRYFQALSYGKFRFHLRTVFEVGTSGHPLIPVIEAPDDDVKDWKGLSLAYVAKHAEKIWTTSGGLTRNGKRLIPSLVLVHRYKLGASATTWGYDLRVGNKDYRVGRLTHMPYELIWRTDTDMPERSGRKFWGTLCHEYAHNFLTYGDLYGATGCTGYWDLLGDNSPPGHMSEVCSYFKERVGWISWKGVIRGRNYAKKRLNLRPYTTSGEAYKIVPDPVNKPQEFFILEFRKKTCDEVWRPDRVLGDGGLLIIHMNEALGGVPPTWLSRESPFFDVEHADFDKDEGTTLWTGHDDTEGALFPWNGHKHFTVWTKPSSDFHGGLRSGLRITDIEIRNNRCYFSIAIDCETRSGWQVSPKDRVVAGRFTADSREEGINEVFVRNDNESALMLHREGQWLVQRFDRDRIGAWNLGTQDRELAADFDGDGRDEIYIRSDDWVGLLKWDRHQFRVDSIQEGWVDGWNLGANDWELAADFNGDGKQQVYIRSPRWAGVMEKRSGGFKLQSIHHHTDHSKTWTFAPGDKEYVGRFTHKDRDMILTHRGDRLGLLAWRQDLGLINTHNAKGSIGGWSLKHGDKICVGDFDGDGYDEIFIRNATKAAFLKWSRGRFNMLWLATGSIPRTEAGKKSLPLTGSDRCFAGTFRPGRSGVFHYGPDRVALLLFERGKGFRVRHHLENPVNGLWTTGANDKIVVGDFHRLGRDRAVPERDYIGDDLSDVFILNGSSTGMIGVNYVQHKAGADFREQMGVTWARDGNVLLAWL